MAQRMGDAMQKMRPLITRRLPFGELLIKLSHYDPSLSAVLSFVYDTMAFAFKFNTHQLICAVDAAAEFDTPTYRSKRFAR